MVKFYFREIGSRTSVITGPYTSIEDARMGAVVAGFKVRDVNFLRKEGANLVKIAVANDPFESARQPGA